jgi:hypothetical protein
VSDTPPSGSTGSSAADDTPTADDAPGAQVAEPPRKLPRWRRILVAVLVVLACVLAPLSLVAVWTRNTLLHTDQYVDTVAPLAAKPDVQEALANITVTQLDANVDVEQEVSDALPERAKFIAPFVAQGIDRFVHELALRFFESDAFDKLWKEVNRRAHTRLVQVLTGEGTKNVETENGEVVVNLNPVVDRIRERVSNLGISIFENRPRQLDARFTLFKSESLTKVQGLTSALDTLAIVLPILALVLLGTALALSGNRRRTLLRAALGIAFGIGLVLLALNLVRGPYLDAVKQENRDAAGDAYDQILSFLRTAGRAAMAAALIVALGAWLAGPGKLATTIREKVRDLARGEGDHDVTAVGTFVGAHRTPLRVLVVGIGLVVLVLMSAPSGIAVLVVALLVLAALIAIEFLARGAPRTEEATGS